MPVGMTADAGAIGAWLNAWAGAWLSACVTSPFVTRPSRPDPTTDWALNPFSANNLAAAGIAMSPCLPPVGAETGAEVGAAGATVAETAVVEAVAVASVSMRAINSPATTVPPSPLSSSTRTPAAGAGNSRTTLSVSMSIRFSSRETASPTFLCQFSKVASATDSDN